MLSYAQNMEDVVLAGLFAGQSTGFYIDIGGGHAVADNVSFFSYEQGWRGIVVEPQTHLAALYAHIRPRDTVISALAGQQEGTLDLFEATTFHGLSTASTAHALAAEKAGVTGKRVSKPVTTLARLCADHAPAVIDFLKIDVEGHEADVLRGNDWQRYRPKVVLVEAIEPITMEDASYRFEPLLLAADYRFAFFDDLNRWYVAAEVAETMMARFPSQPPAWDSVTHLGEYGPAHTDTSHPDHVLAVKLVGAFLARLPELSQEDLIRLTGKTADKAALARISSLFDGGYIV